MEDSLIELEYLVNKITDTNLLNEGLNISFIDSKLIGEQLSNLLTYFNGQPRNILGGIFFGAKLLSYSEIMIELDLIKTIQNIDGMEAGVNFPTNNSIKRTYMDTHWIPFLSDGGGNYIGVDNSPGVSGKLGQVINFGPDEDDRKVFFNSINEMLEAIIKLHNSPDYHISIKEDGDYISVTYLNPLLEEINIFNPNFIHSIEKYTE